MSTVNLQNSLYRAGRDTEDGRVSLICPRDGTILAGCEGVDRYTCSTCGAGYPVTERVVRFLDSESGFYGNAYFNHIKYLPKSERWFHVLPLWMINNGYVWSVRKHVPESGVIVELGCACGVDYFAKRYRMIGLDLSFTALKRTAGQYAVCLQADARKRIPLADDSVDAVISSYFWEHIPPGDKPTILGECRRILKPGGKLLFLYDVETENGLIGLLKKKDIGLYRRLFIESDGHLGYQTPEENKNLFLRSGFAIQEWFGMERTWIQSHSVYLRLMQAGGVMGFVGKIGNISARKILCYAHMLAVLLVDHSVGRIFPENRSRILMTVAIKDP